MAAQSFKTCKTVFVGEKSYEDNINLAVESSRDPLGEVS